MNKKKMALVHSMIALLLCCSMLIGTTFAWFTDSVTSGKNRIIAGNLDVALYHSNAAVQNESVAGATDLFMDLQGEAILWEPGVVSYENLRVANEGDMALTYQLSLNFDNENFVIDPATAEQYGLSQILQVGVVEGGITATNREGVVASVTNWTTLADFTRSGSLAADQEQVWGVVIYWEPGEDDNRWNLNNGKQLNEGETLQIDLSVTLLATQEMNESDSFNNKYDQNAKAEFFDGFQGGAAGAVVALDDQGITTAEVAVQGGDVAAVIPAGVQVAEGNTSLGLSVTLKDASEANIQLGESEEKRALDVHIEGVAQGNTVPMLITLKHYLSTGINTGALRLYHVENGATVAMTQVAVPANHNEFSYDPATGDVTLALASFSEVAVVADNNNPWNGKAATAFAGGTGTETDPYQIANADQMAHFRDLVDGGESFKDKFVKLNNNINMGSVNFDPIGWGYVNTTWNRDGAAGKVFQGTFDGNNKTIYNLHQQGWDLEAESSGTKDYTYTNCGFGLFAAAADATFKNLTIYGADIKTECVEMGVLVGLSQGSCTYDNITIQEAKIANYQRPTGGLIGEVSPLNGGGETKITNVEIGSDVVVGSLWGDFDAPCGGVIGARWDDTDKTTVVMENVTVGCRMDVYSDVTSAYQWYAYRRAGMLIGNTEQTVEGNQHLADARFLTCKNVEVRYGDWVNYTYYQFTNQDDNWCNGYPWVRAEEGENCSAFSNPRYGQPVVNTVKITSQALAESKKTDYVEIPFNQLYGGGQGVYGQPDHKGVTVDNYRYSITYMNDYDVLAIKYVKETGAVSTENSAAQHLVELWAEENIKTTWKFGGWMNAGSTKLTQIDADNTKNIVLYPYFNNPYTARFVDQQGNVIAYCFFHKEDTTKLEDARKTAEAALPYLGEDLEFDYWQVQLTDNQGKLTKKEEYNVSNFGGEDGYKQDVTIYPVYLYKGDVNLIPVDSDSDGIINYYQVGGYSNPNGQAMVEIPASVNGIPILQINEGAFSGYDGVHSIVVPNGVTIQKNAFTSGSKLGSGEEITIYFEGTKEQWNGLTKTTGWDYGIGTGSRIFFLKDGKVDTTQGYREVVGEGGFIGIGTKYKWSDKTDFATVKEVYVGTCNCSISTTGDTAHTYKDANGNVMGHNDAGTPVNANGTEIYLKESGLINKKYSLTDGTNTYYRYRPDAAYWEGVTAN